MPGMGGLPLQLVLAAPRPVMLEIHLYTLPLAASTKCVALLEMALRWEQPAGVGSSVVVGKRALWAMPFRLIAGCARSGEERVTQRVSARWVGDKLLWHMPAA